MSAERASQFVQDVGPDVAIKAAKRLSDSIRRRKIRPTSTEDPTWAENQETLLFELLAQLLTAGHLTLEKAKELATSPDLKEELEATFK